MADETEKFMVIEFDRNEKRIVLSHTRIWEQAKAEEKDVARKEAKAGCRQNPQSCEDDPE